MSSKRIITELRKWFADKEIFELSLEHNNNGVITFHGSMYHVLEYEYQWLHKHNGAYHVTDSFYTKESDIPKPPCSSCWSRIDDSRREK